MLKRSLVFVILAILAGSAAAGAAWNHYRGQGQAGTTPEAVENHIGDLHLRFRDYEEVAVPTGPAPAVPKTQGVPAGPGPSSVTAPTPAREPEASANPYGAEGGEAGGSARQQPSSEDAGSLQARIEQKYLGRLQSLASGYEARLNGMIFSALNECRAARKENPNADLKPIISRYYSAGKGLEAECDSQFYSILSEFEGELRANSLPTDAAAGARDTYEARKSAKMGEMKY